ncbi:MAG TPA: hypothetical protein PLM24_02420 [Methanothrix sp.]|nr:hypothetical protein [Methanothrix sp.]HPJ84459.1 hypothetical protein [Methanothrix sp.]HPR65975.1 hypothetical protein [Methanothrix sp.]
MMDIKSNRLLIRVNRISAWALLVLMIAYIVTGYAWSERIIMSPREAMYWHTSLDLYLVFFFLVHVLISAKFTLRRYGVRHGLVNPVLLAIGLVAFASVLRVS